MPTSATSFENILWILEEGIHGSGSNLPLPEERRSRCRYPLDLSVRFRSLSGRSRFSGVGRTVNMSSGGILVVLEHVGQHEISAGARMEMSIEWPCLLDGKIPLQLAVFGRVLRLEAPLFAATMERHQFRTLRSERHPPTRPGSNVVAWPPCQDTCD